ncbi:beta-N-acetylhexosaminidase [Anseongella ginsenosidimutans]|nr:beta-N-acetylhexosaminidase [Anseongella ginsenosidimutans]
MTAHAGLLQMRGGAEPVQMPSLIPEPQSLKWSGEHFPLDRSKGILIEDKRLLQVAEILQARLASDCISIPIRVGRGDNYLIELRLGSVKAPFQAEEAYRLEVKKNKVVLTANTEHGIFNGIQTLYQLTDFNTGMIAGCHITDYPAFKWRGYMVDVGRNYQSLELLKQQIDIMSRYKLNVFHFHLTEDVAWRLQIKAYPALTSAKSMTRNKGKYYSIDEMKELIQYCKDRFITLVPELDMPGHSAAFTRAMGVDMQTDKGLEIVKGILSEVCETYDVPYIHIGADEVAIRNQHFLPEVTSLIHQYKKEVVGWSPGGNYDDRTIRQLWKDEGEHDIGKGSLRHIESRYLYLSDMAPQSGVPSIFQRQFGGKKHGDSSLLGAEICLWDDRRVEQETDHLRMNAVYPSMLAFSERSWKGGGYPGKAADIGPDSSARAKDFAAFEKRLITHKKNYFRNLPFPYVAQTAIKWKLFGPFENHGDVTASFWPEAEGVSPEDSLAAVNATGGTVYLWHHTYDSPVSTWIPAPKVNTTWYAFTRFWSGADTTIHIWAEFLNIARSGADATPPTGEWDYKKSKLWINGLVLDPPEWAYPGRPMGLLEEPLVDEGYYFRRPAIVNVKKGWNSILVKLPLAAFDLPDWHAPPKWMFTVIPVQKADGVNWYASEIRYQPHADR